MVTISKQQFDELVANTTKYLEAYQTRLVRMEAKIEDYERRLSHMESRKKPGPKPKVQAA